MPVTAFMNASADVEEVLVTGTRVIRDGYELPTPTSVLNSADLEIMAVPNIADAVTRMPVFTRSTTRTNAIVSGAGAANLNLRGLGPIRTLVLLDGRRLVGAGGGTGVNAVDINVMPTGLISRVDVVTGGASAVYGSDALAGVVNFVLDKKFEGVRGTAQGGMTTHGDDENFLASLALGTSFASGRGHVLLSGEAQYSAGIKHNNRAWADSSYSMMVNPAYTPTNGQPQYIAASNTGLATATRGGLITSGPLRGTMFLAGGAPATFHYGPIVSGNMMSGGDWQLSRIDRDVSLSRRLERSNAFSRISFDLTERSTIFGELGWADTSSRALSGVPFFHLGNITVNADNPFIPPSVRESMQRLGLTSFTLGTTNGDLGTLASTHERTFFRYVLGAEGSFDMTDTVWNWNLYYQRSKTDYEATIPGNEITANYRRAADAVIHPDNGRIVCRSTLTDPDDGCVPFNVMGIGVNSPAAVAYVTGTSWMTSKLTQDVLAASVTGDPFSTWAGPVTLAFSAEYRKEKIDGAASELDEARAFFAGNFSGTTGDYDVVEGALEAVVPLAKDQGWARSFDLNTAARFTRYSTSGEVTTWKIGATYKPIGDIGLRVTRSRDIRAPNIIDLFSAGRSDTVTVNDAGVSTVIVARTSGNPNLDPEKADTTGIGLVFQPSFLPGFGASIDYYDIDIQDAIVPLGAQTYVDGCNSGITSLCSFIERDADGRITFVALQPVNIASQRARGLDIEVSYRAPLSSFASSNASLTLRGLATYVETLEATDTSSTFEGAGVLADNAGIGIAGAAGFLVAPRWKYLVSASYERDAFSAAVTARGIGSGVYNHRFIECTTACPPSTPLRPTLGTSNHIGGVVFYDLAFQYRLWEEAATLFFAVQNVFNRDPPRIAAATSNGFYIGQGNLEYSDDRIGRVFSAGVRFEF